MSYTYVNKQQTAGSDSSPIVISINIGTRTNGMLVIGFSGAASNTVDASSATYNGVTMGEFPSTPQMHANGWFSQVFYLENPTNGTNDLSISYSVASGGFIFGYTVTASWYDGGKQSSPIDQTNSNQGSTDPSLSVTPTEDNELIVDSMCSQPSKTVGSGETQLYLYNFGGYYSGDSYAIQTSATSQTVDWTGTDGQWTMSVVTLKQEPTSSTLEINKTDSLTLADVITGINTESQALGINIDPNTYGGAGWQHGVKLWP